MRGAKLPLAWGCRVAWTHPFWFGTRRPRFKVTKSVLKLRAAPFKEEDYQNKSKK